MDNTGQHKFDEHIPGVTNLHRPLHCCSVCVFNIGPMACVIWERVKLRGI